jgi:serine/threonine protein kinase
MQNSSLAHQLLPNTILDQRYLIEKVLAEGGFGIIYVGRDLRLEMVVAIKEYYPFEFASRNHTYSEEVTSSGEDAEETFEEGKDNFYEEAKAMAQFSEEAGVVKVRDYFKENNTAYIVMDYLRGVNLKTWLEDNKLMSAGEVLSLMKPIMTTLSRIHKKGLIHRDISPDNIMVLEDKSVKLLDFGATRKVSVKKDRGLTILLKRGFAPEEQHRTKGRQGPWTDVYALCATIYKCITGIIPDEATERLRRDNIKRPSQLGVSISRSQEKALMRGMAVLQEDRYQTIDELVEQLFSEENIGFKIAKEFDEE